MKLIKTMKKDMPAWLLAVPAILILLLTNWQPLVTGLWMSFYETKGYEAVEFIGLQNYVDVISNSAFIRAFWNTFAYVGWSMVLGYLVPLALAVMLNEMIRGKGLFRFCVYFPAMLPGIATAFMWKMLMNPGEGGILNAMLTAVGFDSFTWLSNQDAVIPLIVATMTWKGFGATTLLYLAALQGISGDLYEAAKMDGAGFFKRIWHIQLPATMGLMMLSAVRQIISVFQVMYDPMVMTSGGPNNSSMSLMYLSYEYAFTYYKAGHALAVGGITFVLLFAMTLVYRWVEKKTRDD